MAPTARAEPFSLWARLALSGSGRRAAELFRDLRRLPVEQGQQFPFKGAIAHRLPRKMHEVDGRWLFRTRERA